MRLNAIIQAVQPDEVVGFQDNLVRGVACHPSEATGDAVLFVCMDEYLEYNLWQTWRAHLEQLNSLNLAAVIAPKPIPGLQVPQLVTQEPRKALGLAARMLHGCPDQDLQVIGVTGTNGKTTTTRLLSHLLNELGVPCGSLGTLGVQLTGGAEYPGTYTTPLSPQMYAHLGQMKQRGAKAVALEVSSHGLALDRVEGLEFDAAILTNVERDHLDFHGTQEAYTEAKMRLFGKVKPSGLCVLNKDSFHCTAFAAVCSGKVITYGKHASGADFELLESRFLPTGSEFKIREKEGTFDLLTQLVGHFQVENILAAVSLLRSMGHSPRSLCQALSTFPPVCGRMEQIHLSNGATAIVDYAHNPDGLKNLLLASRGICKGRLHLVVGCGGDRDKGKRSIMGRLAAEMADICTITSDNPRTEDPLEIIQDVMYGMPAGMCSYCVEADRAKAIRQAYAATRKGDVLVIAGKGHEDYQIIGMEKHHFSDQEILRDL